MKNLCVKAVCGFLLSLPLFSPAQNYNLTLQGQLPYPGQTLANICGYSAGGNEYALVGAEDGMSIVNVTNPANPVEIVQIPNITNLWKEIKVYQNYAYVT